MVLNQNTPFELEVLGFFRKKKIMFICRIFSRMTYRIAFVHQVSEVLRSFVALGYESNPRQREHRQGGKCEFLRGRSSPRGGKI